MCAVSVPMTKKDWHTLSSTGFPSALEKFKSCFTVPWREKRKDRQSCLLSPHYGSDDQLKFCQTDLWCTDLYPVWFHGVEVLTMYSYHMGLARKRSWDMRRIKDKESWFGDLDMKRVKLHWKGEIKCRAVLKAASAIQTDQWELNLCCTCIS